MLLPDTSVTMVTVLPVRISGLDSQQEYISSTPLCPDWLWSPLIFPFSGCLTHFSGGKFPEREADRFLLVPSSKLHEHRIP